MNEILEKFRALKKHQDKGGRSPHKPLLVLLALGRLRETGSSSLLFSEVEEQLRQLIVDFGPPRASGGKPEYPFTRLESSVWHLDREVQKDSLTELRQGVAGSFTPEVEAALLADDGLAQSLARMLVSEEFGETQMQNVLIATGLGDVAVSANSVDGADPKRSRSSAWPGRVLLAWNRTCAFCGFSGHLGNSAVGLEAAHIRWFNKGGPDELDNGLALCAIDHSLLDSGVFGITEDHRIKVSQQFWGPVGGAERVFALAGQPIRTPNQVAAMPRHEHVRWHDEQVFK